MRFPFRTRSADQTRRYSHRHGFTRRSAHTDFELALTHAEPAVREEAYAAARRAGFQHL